MIAIPPLRLGKAIAYADKRMRSFRSQRIAMLREFAGPWWGPQGNDQREPLNTLFALAQSFLPVMSIEPKAQADTDFDEKRRFARTMALALNSILRDMQFSGIVDDINLDAMFGPAITFTGLAAGEYRGMDEIRGSTHDPDETFTETISPDDYVPDPFARRRCDMLYEADRIRIPRDWALAQKDLFDTAALEQLPKVGDNQGGQTKERADGLSRPSEQEDDRAIDEIEAFRVWLPQERKIVGIRGDVEVQDATDWLWERPYKYEESPYDQLGFMPMPDSTMPVPVMGIMFDLHTLINTILRKQARGAENFKQLLLYLLGREKDMNAILDARDLSAVGVADPKAFQSVQFNGADPEGFAVADKFREYANWVSGNPDAVGGLGKQSDTLGQDQMLWSNASAKLAFWRKRLLAVLTSIARKVAHHLWDDPLKEMVLADKLSGIPRAFRRVWRPEVREGDFEDYTITVQPHGMESETPEKRYQRTMDWVQRLVVPLAPLAAQQGMRVDVEALVRETGQMAEIPGSDEFVVPAMPIAEPSGAGGVASPAAAGIPAMQGTQ
jgi:hypothetical protein